MKKEDNLENLYSQYSDEFKAEEVVLGSGQAGAKILLVGEAPGKDEVRLGKPFVGQAGQNLSQFLEFLELKREDIFITNAIKYRLSKVSPSTGGLINRPAGKTDILKNRNYLVKEVCLIHPTLIVTLGNVPLRSLFNDMNRSIGSVHGQELELQLEMATFKVFPLYHPASIIYNHALQDTYQQDLIQLKHTMDTLL